MELKCGAEITIRKVAAKGISQPVYLCVEDGLGYATAYLTEAEAMELMDLLAEAL